MLFPKKTKYKKMHASRLKGKALSNNGLIYGKYGLQALEPIFLKAAQIDSMYRTLLKYTNKKGQIILKIFPDRGITARSKDSRMGSGKGSLAYWSCLIYPNNIIFELVNLEKNIAFQAIAQAQYKLPIKTRCLVNLLN